MVKLCCIPICPNAKADRGVDCYPFPSADATLRRKWIDFLGANARNFRWKTKYICAEHFHQLELVETGDGRREPAEGAVPIVYSPDEDEDDELMERDGVMVSESTVQPNKVEPLREIAELRSLFCRLCLKKGDSLIPLNSKLHNENLVDILFTIAGLVIQDEEDLPTKICASCVGKLDLAFNVRVEFMHYEEILRNLINNNQLKAHYQSYDNHPKVSRSWNETYLTNLMDNAKQDVTIERPGELLNSNVKASKLVKIEPVVVEDELPEEMEEEHLYDEEESGSAEGKPAEQETEDAKNLVVKIESESEKEQTSTTEYVISWTTLCKPKRTQRPPKVYKITEDLPEPELVPHTCYVCNTVCKDADDLEFHIERHVNLVPYTCDQCSTAEVPQVLKSLISLNKHLQSHLFPYRCDYCPMRSPSRKAYIAHMGLVHEKADQDGYTCDDCGKQFDRKRLFTNHLYKHKVLKEEPVDCDAKSRFSGTRLRCERCVGHWIVEIRTSIAIGANLVSAHRGQIRVVNKTEPRRNIQLRMADVGSTRRGTKRTYGDMEDEQNSGPEPPDSDEPEIEQPCPSRSEVHPSVLIPTLSNEVREPDDVNHFVPRRSERKKKQKVYEDFVYYD